jgi:hypothetical protein
LILAKLVMVAFVKVLEEVGDRCAEAEASVAPYRLGLVEPYAPQTAGSPISTGGAVAAYRHVQGERPATSPRDDNKTEAIAALVSQADPSPKKLRLLRRRLAWRLHPDRGPERDSRPLAEVNAAIDAALARCSSARE